MKTFTFRYDSNATPDDLFARIGQAAKSGIADVRKDETASNSIHAILSAMTEGRLQVFYVIADQQPSSMYQLAQVLQRDQADVLRDVKALEAMSLIALVSEKDGDLEGLRPVTSYDRIVFDFGAAGMSGNHRPIASG